MRRGVGDAWRLRSGGRSRAPASVRAIVGNASRVIDPETTASSDTRARGAGVASAAVIAAIVWSWPHRCGGLPIFASGGEEWWQLGAADGASPARASSQAAAHWSITTGRPAMATARTKAVSARRQMTAEHTELAENRFLREFGGLCG